MNYAIRLNALLQKRGVASRRHADELIQKGAVRVNGVVVKEVGTKVARNAHLSVDGIEYKRSPRRVTYLFHKPSYVMSTRHDEHDRKTIFDCVDVKTLPKNVQNVGRLDYQSEGLMILTNDGDLLYTLTHPKHDIEKIYSVLLSRIPTTHEIETLKNGVMLEDGFAKPIRVKLQHHQPLGNTMGQWVEIVVTEGRNRLIRRMCEFFGFSVVRLVRTAIGTLTLPRNLAPGCVRPVTRVEKNYLMSLKHTKR